MNAPSMMLSTLQASITYLPMPRLRYVNPFASSPRHSPAPATNCRRLSLLPTAALPNHHIAIFADYVPKFPRIFDAPAKDFIAPDVPLLPGFNADNMTRLFLPDLINTETIYTLLLLISCAAAVVYLELGALFNDFTQEKDFEKLEEQYLRQQKNLKNGGDEDLGDSGVSSAELERKRGIGWLAFATAVAIWCTGILNKINPFQP